MENLLMERAAPDRQAVALKAYARIADGWSLSQRDAAALGDMSESTWKRAKKPGFAGGNDINYIKPKNMSEYVGKLANPYRYGYMIEINGAASADDEELVKHFATGRLSHETAAIMPDNRTLYMIFDCN